MTDPVFAADPARLLIAAAAGIALLLLLIIKFKVHPVLSLLISALGITGLAVGTTVFFEAGVVILIPLAFVPPSAGSVLVANMLQVDLGVMIAVGLPMGVLSLIFAGILWSK